MQQNFGICIFIGQCTKGGEFAGSNVIKHAIDVHAHMFVDDKETALDDYLHYAEPEFVATWPLKVDAA